MLLIVLVWLAQQTCPGGRSFPLWESDYGSLWTSTTHAVGLDLLQYGPLEELSSVLQALFG